MNRAGRVIFILGIFIALVSGSGVFLVLLLSQPKPAEVPTTKVVVAFQQINPRTEIVADQVGTTNWPRAVPTPPGAFSDPSDVIGKLAMSPLYQGEVIIQNNLVDKSEVKEDHSTAALVVEKGYVAIAMPVSIKADIAGAIQAGDRVDLIATFQSQSATGSAAIATQRVLADILVLQVGSWPTPEQKKSDAATTILTFQLKEQEALILEYTMLHANSVTLALRSANDHDVLPLDPITFDYINQRFNFKLAR
ncbi:MAG: Flp pilus assembly protein CpaB [Chloroflexi bacterium]|nr:Flp pilus assembly protein CpaB [Chloroflexota bacterium]